jgi:uncharacterized membrane protein YfhO
MVVICKVYTKILHIFLHAGILKYFWRVDYVPQYPLVAVTLFESRVLVVEWKVVVIVIVIVVVIVIVIVIVFVSRSDSNCLVIGIGKNWNCTRRSGGSNWNRNLELEL